MNNIETNQILRQVIQELVDLGYKKTVIGQILLGQSGYVPLVNFLDDENKVFGIKPLSRLCQILDYDLHVVFVDKNNKDSSETLDSLNNEFFTCLKTNIVTVLNDLKTEEGAKKYSIKRKRKSDTINIVSSIISNFLMADLNIDTNSKQEDIFDDGTELE